MDILSNLEYKHLFLPSLEREKLSNDAPIQIYKLEEFLRGIVMPVVPYRTDFNFILFVTEGALVQYFEKKPQRVEAGQILFIKRGSITATEKIQGDVKGYFLAYEDTVLLEQDLGHHKASLFEMTAFQKLDRTHFDILLRLFTVLEEELWLAHQHVNELSVTLLHTILLKMIDIDNHEYKHVVSRPFEISLQFRDLLFKHHIQEKNVSFYADKLSITVNYLNKCVKSVTQKSPKQWINQVDIDYGKALLHSSESIAEIAFQLNFQTASHFTQLFKKLTGMTPKDFRKHYINNTTINKL